MIILQQMCKSKLFLALNEDRTDVIHRINPCNHVTQDIYSIIVPCSPKRYPRNLVDSCAPENPPDSYKVKNPAPSNPLMITRVVCGITGNRRRLTFLSSSIALSFSFSSSMVASLWPVSNFSFMGMSFSAEYLSDFWAYCPSCWVCLSASKSFFTCKGNKQQPSTLIL